MSASSNGDHRSSSSPTTLAITFAKNLSDVLDLDDSELLRSLDVTSVHSWPLHWVDLLYLPQKPIVWLELLHRSTAWFQLYGVVHLQYVELHPGLMEQLLLEQLLREQYHLRLRCFFDCCYCVDEQCYYMWYLVHAASERMKFVEALSFQCCQQLPDDEIVPRDQWFSRVADM